MNHIVFVVGQYSPNASPNGAIASALIGELCEDNEITVVTRQNTHSLPRIDVIDGVEVVRVPDWNLIAQDALIHRISRVGNSSRKFGLHVLRMFLYTTRGFFLAPRVIRPQSSSTHYERKLERVLRRIDHHNPIDVLICVSAPHEEVFAGVRYKRRSDTHCALLIYQLDRFSNGDSLYPSPLLKRVQKHRNQRLESLALEACDRLFILEPLRLHYQQSRFERHLGKITVTEHPLVRDWTDPHGPVVERGEGILATYAGSFDRRLRNPTQMLELFSHEKLPNVLSLQLYSFGNCQDIIDRYARQFPARIVDHGRVSTSSAHGALRVSDILVTLGNDSDEEVPSKLFEYLSFGKPIVHLYLSPSDAYLSYLSMYPAALCLKLDSELVEDNVLLLSQFCQRWSGKTVSFKEIESLYHSCTPSFVAKVFKQAISGVVIPR